MNARGPACKRKRDRRLVCLFSGCQKVPEGLFDSLKNAVTFVPHSGTKVLALLAASLVLQGIAGHSISFEAGCRPLELPCPN